MLKENLFKRLKIMVVLCFAVACISVFLSHDVAAKNLFRTEQTNDINDDLLSDGEKINLINIYQAKYFELIKKNNVLLSMEDSVVLNNDRKELENLFAQVKQQITNKRYLNKYTKIQKRFAECNEETTVGINEFADKNYKAVDALLQNVYKKAEGKLSSEDEKKLALSQINWENNVNDYQKVYDSTDFGTIGTSVYLNYETNMREFRALLMMLLL